MHGHGRRWRCSWARRPRTPRHRDTARPSYWPLGRWRCRQRRPVRLASRRTARQRVLRAPPSGEPRARRRPAARWIGANTLLWLCRSDEVPQRGGTPERRRDDGYETARPGWKRATEAWTAAGSTPATWRQGVSPIPE
ncbi:hypothetical protein ACFOPN_08765 [Xanthomonas hyacinthi]|uniref:hypothetical protein n=1 Tax=Xanthomonas hyacinthi TaxID=56455 RepID=UPI00362003AB